MFIELIDSLRCLRPHAASWLVASMDRTVGRSILDGTLGCPVCGAEYPVEQGVTHFGSPDAPGARLPEADAATMAPTADPESALRLAAMLDLVDEGGVVLLAGGWSAAAAPLLSIARTTLLVVNPPAGFQPRMGLTVVRVSGAVPLAAASLRAAAVDGSAELPAAGVARALRPRGRLVGPVRLPLPEGVAELARDDEWWVADRAAGAPTLVGLGRRQGA